MTAREEGSNPFHKKICVITGAGSGIGRAIALQLHNQGALLALSDIDEDGLAETKKLIGEHSNTVSTDILDVANAEAIEAYGESVKNVFGDADYVFNVAGITTVANFVDMPLSSFEKVMNINFWGTVRMTKVFLPQLLATKGGVINISSLFGLVGAPSMSHYSASKFAVRGFSETISQELRKTGVSVTSVHPGGVATNIANNATLDAPVPGVKDAKQFQKTFDKLAGTTAEDAAAQIIAGAAKGKRRVVVGRDAVTLSFLQRLFPTRYRDITQWLASAGQRRSRKK